MTDAEYKKILKRYHKLSERHILVAETDMSYPDVQRVISLSDRIRKAGNELAGLMRKCYEQMMRTKRYRKLRRLYAGTSDLKLRQSYSIQLREMQEMYHVTWEFCRTSMIPIRKKYGIDSVFALSRAEDVWSGIEKCLYGAGKTIHFTNYDALPSIRAKQRDRGITIFVRDGKLQFKLKNMVFGLRIRDRFQREESDAVISYLSAPESEDHRAVETFLEESCCIDTYRPCYATLVLKKIRGRYRVFLHLTIEGRVKPKYDRYGAPMYHYGTGMIGADIGIQTVAYTSDSEVGLKNLAERGYSIRDSERRERLLYRAMERSRRASDPQNYEVDGVIRTGLKKWHYSNHYKKLREKHRELCRINAVNRELAIREDINHLRGLGNVFITEPKNAARLMKRAKQTTFNRAGKYNRKKRFGRSIQNRCPGMFQAIAEKKFRITQGTYIEVPADYRASQYDHTADDYIRKKLSLRMFRLLDGTKVQRDWYSSFLLYCFDPATDTIDKVKCRNSFPEQYAKEKALIEWIRVNKIKILNSGINVA